MFPNVTHKGCRFPFNSAILRNIDAYGLRSLFNQDAKFQETIYMLYALVYLPPDQVVSFYNEELLPIINDRLKTEESWKECADELDDFGDYYAKTWIEKRGGRPPLFPIQHWNHYNDIVADSSVAQTNNIIESYNRTLNGLVGKNPNVWTLTEVFIQQAANSRRNYFVHASGRDNRVNTGRKQRSLDRNGRIKLWTDE